ncbi:MAG: ketoacyl-ACP synthase III, partial [Candidatus Omnitrophica bacterium]|nr:ketoacyl-ACP synthase III [Candidatus Omnitrophota bacterium]
MKKVGILGLGKNLPDKILTNRDLEKMVDTSDEWITTRTGIKERRIVEKGQAASDLATKAAREAMKEAGLKASELDMIIVATITPDMQLPATACFVQANLGAKNAFCFDISAACAGFLYGIVTAQQYIARGTCNYALVIGSEIMSSITDWQDRSTCVLFGDGAGAAVLGEVKSGGILSSYLGSDGTKIGLLNLPGGGSKNPASHETIDERLHYVKMQGNELFKVAVTSMAEAAQSALKRAGLKCADVNWIIPHQANLRIINAVAKRLGFVNAQVYLTIERYGNMSSACTV